jgi:hypothetical protein
VSRYGALRRGNGLREGSLPKAETIGSVERSEIEPDPQGRAHFQIPISEKQ